MIVEISSENPNLMSILRKNPNSFNGLQLRSLKNGVAIGRIVSDHKYDMIFQDTKYSFTGDHSSQIDYQSYCNPRVFLSMAGIYLRHLLVEKEDYLNQEIPWLNKTVSEVDSENFTTTIRIPNVYADGFNLSRGFVLAKYFPEISFERKIGCLHELEITARGVFKAVNLAALTLMYLAATNDQPWYINKDIAQKYIRIAKNLSPVPYFVLYLFARRCLPTKALFEELKDELVSATDLDVSLEWGNTQIQRIEAVRDILVDSESGMIPEKNVVEIGCGEMNYPSNFLKNLQPDGVWFAHDLEDYSSIAERLNRKHSERRVEFRMGGNIEKGDPWQNNILLAIEVIEHMPYEEAALLLKRYIERHLPERVVITTPNFNFNQYYAIEKFRHDDHHFELTPKEFEVFVKDLIKSFASAYFTYKPKFFGIGDRVEDDHMSLGCLLTRSF